MKKSIILSLILICLVFAAFVEAAEQNDSVLLQWKVNQPVAFKTAMEATDESQVSFDNFLDDKKLDSSLKNFSWVPKSFSLLTFLTPLKSGNISVKMAMDNINWNNSDTTDQEGWKKFLSEMSGKVQLRGEMNKFGEVTSFYLVQGQKNIISLFFELPKNPIRIGDSWPLNVYLCSAGQGFICEKAERINKVQLVDLKPERDGETIAILQYTIVENVAGKLQGFNNKFQPVSMKYSFIGKAEFFIKKGIWKSFAGELRCKTSSEFMNSDTTQIFALQPMETVPKMLLDIE